MLLKTLDDYAIATTRNVNLQNLRLNFWDVLLCESQGANCFQVMIWAFTCYIRRKSSNISILNFSPLYQRT